MDDTRKLEHILNRKVKKNASEVYELIGNYSVDLVGYLPYYIKSFLIGNNKTSVNAFFTFKRTDRYSCSVLHSIGTESFNLKIISAEKRITRLVLRDCSFGRVELPYTVSVNYLIEAKKAKFNFHVERKLGFTIDSTTLNIERLKS